MSLLFRRKSYARLGGHREGIVCPHYVQPVVLLKKGLRGSVLQVRTGPREMWSVLRPENVPAVSFSVVGKCSCLRPCKFIAFVNDRITLVCGGFLVLIAGYTSICCRDGG
jgi:hypothetical protein